MITNLTRLSLILILLSIVPMAFAESMLKHDPFARPLMALTPTNTAADTQANVQDETPWNPTLSAVMVAGKSSLVNLDGLILRLGEEKEGYRLIQVKDREAVFKKGKKIVKLEIKANAADAGNELALDTEKPMLRRNLEQDSRP